MSSIGSSSSQNTSTCGRAANSASSASAIASNKTFNKLSAVFDEMRLGIEHGSGHLAQCSVCRVSKYPKALGWLESLTVALMQKIQNPNGDDVQEHIKLLTDKIQIIEKNIICSIRDNCTESDKVCEVFGRMLGMNFDNPVICNLLLNSLVEIVNHPGLNPMMKKGLITAYIFSNENNPDDLNLSFIASIIDVNESFDFTSITNCCEGISKEEFAEYLSTTTVSSWLILTVMVLSVKLEQPTLMIEFTTEILSKYPKCDEKLQVYLFQALASVLSDNCYYKNQDFDAKLDQLITVSSCFIKIAYTVLNLLSKDINDPKVLRLVSAYNPHGTFQIMNKASGNQRVDKARLYKLLMAIAINDTAPQEVRAHAIFSIGLMKDRAYDVRFIQYLHMTLCIEKEQGKYSPEFRSASSFVIANCVFQLRNLSALAECDYLNRLLEGGMQEWDTIYSLLFSSASDKANSPDQQSSSSPVAIPIRDGKSESRECSPAVCVNPFGSDSSPVGYWNPVLIPSPPTTETIEDISPCGSEHQPDATAFGPLKWALMKLSDDSIKEKIGEAAGLKLKHELIDALYEKTDKELFILVKRIASILGIMPEFDSLFNEPCESQAPHEVGSSSTSVNQLQDPPPESSGKSCPENSASSPRHSPSSAENEAERSSSEVDLLFARWIRQKIQHDLESKKINPDSERGAIHGFFNILGDYTGLAHIYKKIRSDFMSRVINKEEAKKAICALVEVLYIPKYLERDEDNNIESKLSSIMNELSNQQGHFCSLRKAFQESIFPIVLNVLIQDKSIESPFNIYAGYSIASYLRLLHFQNRKFFLEYFIQLLQAYQRNRDDNSISLPDMVMDRLQLDLQGNTSPFSEREIDDFMSATIRYPLSARRKYISLLKIATNWDGNASIHRSLAKHLYDQSTPKEIADEIASVINASASRKEIHQKIITEDAKIRRIYEKFTTREEKKEQST